MAKRLQGILDERATAIVGCYGNRKKKTKGDFNSYIKGWQERSEKLYRTAMEVTAVLSVQVPVMPPPPAKAAPAPKKKAPPAKKK
jgi:hypothetical protein